MNRSSHAAQSYLVWWWHAIAFGMVAASSFVHGDDRRDVLLAAIVVAVSAPHGGRE